MADTLVKARNTSGELVGAAVNRSRLLSADGLAERAFTLAFSSLVYPQIWEDPVVDLEALQIDSGSRIIAISSGGCNVLSYLTAEPAQITAVDLNAAHVALTRLKLAAAQHLPTYQQFLDLFGKADRPSNIAAFDRHIVTNLDADTRQYWQARDFLGRRRISRFSRNFYHYGLLGRFIRLAHWVARLHGVDPRDILKATTIEQQRQIFEQGMARLFERGLVRQLVRRPSSLFGLGIPPAQYKALAGSGEMTDVLRHRLGRLAYGFPLAENYFAWQAFGRCYAPDGKGTLPPYLQAQNFAKVCACASRVDARQVSFTDHLARSAGASFDRYVLLDAQDWMSDAELVRLWREITRTAAPGARVIFRTAAEPSGRDGR